MIVMFVKMINYYLSIIPQVNPFVDASRENPYLTHV